MAVWKNEHFVVTNAGDEMLSKAVAGEGEIKVTRIVTGGSYVTPEKLKEQTEVKKIKQTLDIVGVDTDNEGSMITARLSNKDLTDGYLLYQIGIYATFGEDTTEVLYMLAQCDFINPDIIPAAEDTPHQSVYNLYLKHSGTDKITFNVSDTVGVTFSMFDDLKKSTKNSIETMQTEVLGMSESLTTMDEKLNSHISDKEIHITAEEKETWNAAAFDAVIDTVSSTNRTIAYKPGRTKVLLFMWRNATVDNLSNFVFDTMLIENMSSSMTAKEIGTMNSGLNTVCTISVDASGNVIVVPGDNVNNKYLAIWFN